MSRNRDMRHELVKAKKLVQKHFPHLWDPLELSLSTILALTVEDLPHCIGLIHSGAGASGKTTVTELLGSPDFIYHSDKFTPKSLVSHFAAKKQEALEKVDLLPKIKGKALVFPDLSPLFGQRHDDLVEDIGLLTRAFDGRGLLIDSGVHGRRGYEGDYRFVMIAATIPPAQQVWDVMIPLNARWVFNTIESQDQSVAELAEAVGGDYRSHVNACRELVQKLLTTAWEAHGGFAGTEKPKHDPDTIRPLIAAAKEAARWRGMIRVGSPPVTEDPKRLAATLLYIAYGRALLYGRDRVYSEDVKTVARIAYSSMPERRRRLFQAIVLDSRIVTNKQVAALVRCSFPTAQGFMDEMCTLGVVDNCGEDNENGPVRWKHNRNSTLNTPSCDFLP